MSEWIKLIIWIVVLLLPFQILGLVVSAGIRKSDPSKARRIGIVLPAATFFAILLALVLWNYYNPSGVGFLVEGIVHIFLLLALAVGTVLNFLCALVIQSRWRSHG